MQANAGHLLIPIDPQVRQQGENDEYDALTKVYRKPSRTKKRLPGKALEITNTPVIDHKGHKRFFNPLQCACLGLDRAIETDCAVIRVKTPEAVAESGGKVWEEMDFSVPKLKATMR